VRFLCFVLVNIFCSYYFVNVATLEFISRFYNSEIIERMIVPTLTYLQISGKQKAPNPENDLEYGLIYIFKFYIDVLLTIIL
jgi:hypothetical protein